MLLPLKDMAGTQLGELEVSDAIFAAPVNKSLMHQALVRQLANARLGNHNTKTRGEVRGGGRKPWRQKGTGRARQGSTRSPNWVGGGTVFGPRSRSYAKAMPRKMRRAALRSALSVKVAGEQLVVVDEFRMESPKTKAMLSALDALGASGQSVLIVLAEKDENVLRSANNVPNVKTLLGGYLNIRDLLGHDLVLASKGAVEQIDLWLSAGIDPMTTAEPVAAVEAEEIVAAVPVVEPEDVVVDSAADDETVVVEAVADEINAVEEVQVMVAADDAEEEPVVAEAATDDDDDAAEEASDNVEAPSAASDEAEE